MDQGNLGAFINNNKGDFSRTDRSDISSLVNSAYQTIDTLALYAREKTDGIIDLLSRVSADEMCDFNTKNGIYMMRLMRLNEKEKEITLNALGIDAMFNGDSHVISAAAFSPSYAAGVNYKDNFVKNIYNGNSDDVTQAVDDSKGESQVYGNVVNLYPDDDGTGRDKFNDNFKWREYSLNVNSILYKTKKLFNQHKINTLISRFHTSPNTPTGTWDSKTKYGLSHGRNLLTASAESGESGYNTNGYDNPYCRVWTHHHQYDRLDKLIRPFVTKDASGEPMVTKLADFHNWQNFKMIDKSSSNEDDEKKDEWGWKDGNESWKNSVLRDNGFVNITPKFINGGSSNIHTKQCMFSIENLAWRDYNPYSFEKALSWEQRGPMGGRIMWFPPYGLSFNETTSTNWQNSTFIGRGEDVYTYANTVRTGTLNFMLVVDHPSIVDYVQYDEANQSNVKDTDLLRFFAGCDGTSSKTNKETKYDVTTNENATRPNEIFQVTATEETSYENNGLIGFAKPTPLTDEYIEQVKTDSEKVTKKAPKPPVEPKIEPEPDIDIVFYVFFPNNYSGVYDRVGNDKAEIGYNTHVEAIPYLLYGRGAQMKSDGNLTTDLALNFKEITGNEGGGYEMSVPIEQSSPGSDNYIIGTNQRWWSRPKKTPYVKANRKWYYRIDGRYQNESLDLNNLKPLTKNAFVNCYDQNLGTGPTKYKDTISLNLNCSVEKVKKYFNEDENLYSLSEVAYLLCKNDEIKNYITSNGGRVETESERIKKLQDLLNKEKGYELSSISVIGYSNSHDKTITQKLADKRNQALAENRAKTVLDWLVSTHSEWADLSNETTFESSKAVDQKDEKNESGETAKVWRSAKVVMSFKSSKTTTLADANQGQEPENVEDDSEYVGFSKHVDEQGKTYYINENEKDPSKKNRRWIYNPKTDRMEYEYVDGIYNRSDYEDFVHKGNTKDGADRSNKHRYDQEYHFFKVLEQKDPIVFDKLMKKLQYFVPAYHSMTPEGFSARLTFLQQCMRQGNTMTMGDSNAKSANNLAFGRAPYCVLRLGDFYNQMIVIDNLSISYDPLVWDLNTEGAGVIPLIANVSLSFKFIGGGSMYGAVNRLQNAMTFNYFSNVNLYDNRGDRPKYNWDDKAGGAIDHSLKDGSYFYSTSMYKEKK